MGWTGGGLGKDGGGIVEPIAPTATYAVKTIGLGHVTENMEIPNGKKCMERSYIQRPKDKTSKEESFSERPKEKTSKEESFSERPKDKISKEKLFMERPKDKTSKEKPFSLMSKHQLKAPEFQNNFCMNVLLHVLKFVKNDAQHQIVFDPRLTATERKRIHILVEKIRKSSNLNEFFDIKHLTAKHFRLIKDIWVHNCYDLWTESEGEGQERRLCLYKEAPAHVYLVTPEDLAFIDEFETDDGSDENNVQNTEKLHLTDMKDEIQSKNQEVIDDASEEICVLPKIKTENHENINISDGIENIIEMNEHTLESECVTNEKDSLVEKNKLRNDTINIIEINGHKLDSECRTDQKTREKAKNISTIDAIINMCDELKRKMQINDQTVETNDQNSIVNEIKLEPQEDITTKTETFTNAKDSNVLGKIKLDSYKNLNIVKGIDLNEKATEKIKSENDKEMDVNEKATQNYGNYSIFRKIVTYFKEFLEDDAYYKEFRFLGPFTDEQLMYIDHFFDICMDLDVSHSKKKDELLKLFDDDSLEVLEDNNGKRFIHKKQDEHDKLQSEDSSESVMCLDK